MCTADTCDEGTFLNSSTGNCVGKHVVVNTTDAMRPLTLFFVVACAAGCKACTGPNNSDCLACEDETLYRVTTDQRASNTCITADECATPTISAFGDRICNMIKIITTPTSELPTTPTEASTLPTVSPTPPTESSTFPTESPMLPAVTPTMPTESPTLPTESPMLPTVAPTIPIESPTLPTESPMLPTVAPTHQGVSLELLTLLAVNISFVTGRS